jgi:hypothetical protein
MHGRCFLGQASRNVFLEAVAAPRSYRVQAHKQTSVCPHVEEVHARKWKLYAPTQDTALFAHSEIYVTLYNLILLDIFYFCYLYFKFMIFLSKSIF